MGYPTLFKVTHHNNAILGIAKMVGKRVTYKTDAEAYGWFEARSSEWLTEFRKIVRRLCVSTGHSGKFQITTDEDSGISVERL